MRLVITFQRMLDDLIVQARDLAVDAARRDDAIVDLQALEKLLHLLLLALRREQDDEIENPQDQEERDDLDQGIRPIGHQAHGKQRHGHYHHRSCIKDLGVGGTSSRGTTA